MNKKAIKWIIGSLALAVIVPTVAFMLVQERAIDKIDMISDQQEVGATEAPDDVKDAVEQFKNGTMTEEQLRDRGIEVIELPN
ncbi:hypothetical protein C2W64_01603 [Brevibacillus laterosporus]|nr:hypothetical protein [Brevibacillus laterosporus]RAP30407.1 hypothetical protein C2W64_01603 [Brevibacillus laterosporus]